MALAHALIGLLARGERYGYELRRELEEEFGAEWRLDFGQLYRALRAARGKKWVAVRRATSPDGPDRKLYTLTRSGRAELRYWLAESGGSVTRGRDEFPVKLRIGMLLRGSPPAHLIDGRRHHLESRRRDDQRRSERAREARDTGRWLLAETRQRQTDGAIAALASCEAVVGKRRPAPNRTDRDALIAVGSDDLVLDLLARRLGESQSEIHFSARPVGSLPGLIALSQKRAHLAGIHLLDIDTGEYNVPFVRHLMPEESVVLLQLARREQGIMIAAGNPKNIRRLRDLLGRGIRLVNRQRGAGTRLLLFHHLRKARIDPSRITGYDREAPTHNDVAAAITAGKADAGPGIRAAAEAWGLEFLPLGQERYDLAVPRKVFESRRFRPLLEMVHQDSFRRGAAAFSGYDVTDMNTIVTSMQ